MAWVVEFQGQMAVFSWVHGRGNLEGMNSYGFIAATIKPELR